jgi:hypothetical protein
VRQGSAGRERRARPARSQGKSRRGAARGGRRGERKQGRG